MNKNVLLISLYELGRQSFGLASAAAFLQNHGAIVTCRDLAIEALAEEDIAEAGLIGIYLPMHTATRISIDVIRKVRVLRPQVALCCFGLYAPLYAPFLQQLGVDEIWGGEFETGLVDFYDSIVISSFDIAGTNGYSFPNQPSVLNDHSAVGLPKQQFLLPERKQLPKLSRYAYLDRGDGTQRTVGYTETTRGCKHLCRHCPIVPVYNGALRVVQKEIVLADIRQQVEAGAQHITFGDPDFFNGPGHSLAVVEEMHDEFPELTYDVTIKVEHLLKYEKQLHRLKISGCLFVISAVESFDDHVLNQLAKGHTYADFLTAHQLCLQIGLFMQPTFVTFHPWLSIEQYVGFLRILAELNLVEAIAPIQYGIRLLIPAQSRLLELDEIREIVEPFDEKSLAYPWAHEDPRLDRLQEQVMKIVQQGEELGSSRSEIFFNVWAVAAQLLVKDNAADAQPPELLFSPDQIAIPRLSEHWYC